MAKTPDRWQHQKLASCSCLFGQLFVAKFKVGTGDLCSCCLVPRVARPVAPLPSVERAKRLSFPPKKVAGSSSRLLPMAIGGSGSGVSITGSGQQKIRMATGTCRKWPVDPLAKGIPATLWSRATPISALPRVFQKRNLNKCLAPVKGMILRFVYGRNRLSWQQAEQPLGTVLKILNQYVVCLAPTQQEGRCYMTCRKHEH